MYHTEIDRQHHYLKKISDKVIVIVCKVVLDNHECSYLFRNINHVLRRKIASLQDIVDNPLGYTGRDILLNKWNDAEARMETLKLIDECINRSVRYNDLHQKSIRLSQAERFEINARKLNSCCR